MAETDAARPSPNRPAIITVDDDPSVSRAVARDLRRQYGEDHRIVRGESGAQTLEVLRELKLRGEQVAVILADYRMPQMNGIEFLEQAMDIFPFARRVLLTAYADTDAAIQAINLVDVDHYLLKPWDPPEERLYPVVDELLDLWRASDHVPVTETKVIGHRWSPRSFEVRDFLARNGVPYRWYPAQEAEAARLMTAAEVGERLHPGRDHARGRGAALPQRRRARRRRWASRSTPPRTSTTWSWSGAAPPGSAPPSTPRPRGCAPCWSSAAPPAGRPARAPGSRTTSASPTASPGRSWPSAPGGRP